MEFTPTLIGQIAGFFAVLQAMPYIWSILKGHTRPSRVSYAIWTITNSVGVISYVSVGATSTVWMPLVLTLLSCSIFCLSFKYGVGGHSPLDLLCLLLAGFAIVLWKITDSPDLAVYMTTFAGFMGYLPTIKKAYTWPSSESRVSWILCVIASMLNVLALTTLEVAISLPPILGLALSSIVATLLLFPNWKIKNIQRKYITVPVNI